VAEPSIVYVIDDDPSIRSSIEDLLQSVGVEVRAFASVQEFLQAKRPERSACVVLDVRLPGQSGLDFQRQMAGSPAELPIVFITGHGDIPMSVRAMKHGAVEFLTKPFRDQDLLDAIQAALERDRARRAESAAVQDVRERLASLTPRENEVMQLVVRGRLNKQIASDLGMSEATVKMHRGQVMRKMDAASVAELVHLAQRLGIKTGADR
jgi:FixJ family two-component response regulator